MKFYLMKRLSLVCLICLIAACSGGGSGGKAKASFTVYGFSITTAKNRDVTFDVSQYVVSEGRIFYEIDEHPLYGQLIGVIPALTYQPNFDFVGQDTFAFSVTDSNGVVEVHSVTIDVRGEESLPRPVAQQLTTNQDIAIDIILASSPANNSLDFSLVAPPEFGEVTGAPPNIQYVPAPGFVGFDQFTFAVSNEFFTSDSAAVDITVNHADGSPPAGGGNSGGASNNNLLVEDLNVTTLVNSPVSILLISNDATATFSLASSSSNGNVELSGADAVYTPNNAFEGTDSFEYFATNAEGRSANATVTIQVTSVNLPPVANAQNVSGEEDSPLAILLTGNDTEGAALTYEIVQKPTSGELVGSPPALSYQPNMHFFGTDSFRFTVSDGELTSNSATVTINLVPVNDVPILLNQTFEVFEDTPATLNVETYDPDPDNLQYIVLQLPQNGALSGLAPNWVYTPNPQFIGSDAFEVRVNDGTVDSATALISVNVREVNDPPIADPIALVINEDEATTVTLTGTDEDDTLLFFQVASQPEFGTVSGSPPNVVYTPQQDYFGLDTFSYQANDGLNNSAPAVVSIQIQPINDPPTSEGQNIVTRMNNPISIDLLATDPDNATLQYTLQSLATNGALEQDNDRVIYTPNQDFTGSDQFNFIASDGLLSSQASTVTINVIDNAAPEIVGEPVLSIKANTPYQFVVSATDEDDDPFTFDGNNLPAWLSVDPESGVVAGVPTNDDIATYSNVSIRAFDGFSYGVLGPFEIQVRPNPWEPLNPMPSGRRAPGAAVIGSTLYIIGGRTDIDDELGDSAGTLVDIYDQPTDTWTEGEPMTFGMKELVAHTVSDTQIITVAGLAKFGIVGTVQMYDVIADTWELRAPMPTRRTRFASAYYDGKVYVIGGSTVDWTETNVVEIYDIATDEWTIGEPRPEACSQSTAVVHSDQIYVLGGWCPGTVGNADIYVPSTDSWTAVEPMQTPRRYFAAVAHQGNIFAMGGFASDPLTEVEMFDPNANVWTNRAEMLTGRHHHVAVVLGGFITVVGGTGQEGMHLPALEIYLPDYDD